MRGILNRDVTRDECHWLPTTMIKGTHVYDFVGCTYGCIRPSGIPIRFADTDDAPFLEVPADSVDWDKEAKDD